MQTTKGKILNGTWRFADAWQFISEMNSGLKAPSNEPEKLLKRKDLIQMSRLI